MYAGVDIGSLVTKTVILDTEGKIESFSILDARSDPELSANQSLGEALSQLNARPDDISFLVATGYGRIAFSVADREVTELRCHGRGASYLHPPARTVIDIGGQDSKVLRIDEKGNTVDFAMNDKCAAGTGRFLEVMSQALEVPLGDLGALSKASKNPHYLSSTCSVFAETEVISLIAAKRPKADIAAGIHHAVARRVGSMAKAFGIEEDVIFVGGVAKNVGVRNALETALGIKLPAFSTDPQITGALGAALIARDLHQDNLP